MLLNTSDEQDSCPDLNTASISQEPREFKEVTDTRVLFSSLSLSAPRGNNAAANGRIPRRLETFLSAPYRHDNFDFSSIEGRPKRHRSLYPNTKYEKVTQYFQQFCRQVQVPNSVLVRYRYY